MTVIRRVLVQRLIMSGAGRRGVVGRLGFVKHVGMRVVLLFCTHGINLGRT